MTDAAPPASDATREGYRQILRATAIIGGATMISLIVGIVRNKVFALVVGPAGLGLFGLFQTILTGATALAGMGLATTAVRQLAVHGAETDRADDARRAIWTLTWPLALLGTLALVVFAEPISTMVAGTPDQAGALRWLAIAVGLTIVSTTQQAVLQGFRRVGDLGRVRVWGALLGAAAGVVAVLALGTDGIVPALIAAPLALIVTAWAFRHNLPRWEPYRRPSRALVGEWNTLLKLGAVVTITALSPSIMQLVVRTLLTRGGGLEAAGLYQAAWGVSATNLTLLLGAMAADYFPRLSALTGDSRAMSEQARQQLRIALALGLPLLVGLAGAAPLALQLLYSDRFVDAASLLRWQIVGDGLKLIGWTLAYVLLARRDMVLYLATELGFALLYVPIFWGLLPHYGLEAPGIAYAVSYFVHAVVLAALVWQRHGVTIDRSTYAAAALGVGLIAGIGLAAAGRGQWTGLALGMTGALVAAAGACYALGIRNIAQVRAALRGQVASA